MQVPTIGRSVHFSHSGQRRHAVIAKVWNDEAGTVNLTVSDDSGNTYGYTSAYYAAEPVPAAPADGPPTIEQRNAIATQHGTWCWPPRV